MTRVVPSRIVDAALIPTEDPDPDEWRLWLCVDLADELVLGDPHLWEVNERLFGDLEFVGTSRDEHSGDVWWRYEARLFTTGGDRSLARLIGVLRDSEREGLRIYAHTGDMIGRVMRSHEMIVPGAMLHALEASVPRR